MLTVSRCRTRRCRAVVTHKPSTNAKKRLSRHDQILLSRALGGVEQSHSDPLDVVLSVRGRPVGVEVKTFCDQTNDKATVHPESLRRKRAWARRQKARVYTVVVDRRDTFAGGTYRRRFSGHRYYLADGTGSYRLGAMRPFDSLAALRRHLTAKR